MVRESYMSKETIKSACVIICAAKGDLRAARGAASSALRSILPTKRFSYVSNGESKSYKLRDPRYTFECSETEFDSLMERLSRAADAAGFTQSPFDCYRD